MAGHKGPTMLSGQRPGMKFVEVRIHIKGLKGLKGSEGL